MASRFYLRNTANSTPISPTPDAAWEDTSLLARATTVKGTKSSDTLTTVALDDATSTDKDCLFRQYVTSLPLTPGQTVTGAQSIKFQCRVIETGTGNNMFSALGIRVIASDGSTVRKTVLAVTRDATEASATTLTNRQFTATSASGNYTTVAGDYLVIEVGMGGDPSGTNHHDSSMRLGDSAASDLAEDDSSTADNNPWVELVDTLAFDTSSTPTVGSALASGVAGTLLLANLITPAVGALAMAAGYATAPRQTPYTYVDAGAGETFFGLDPNAPVSIQVNAGALTTAGTQSPQGITATPSTGALTVAGNAPAVVQAVMITPTVGGMTIAGNAPAVLVDSIRAPPVAELALAGTTSILNLSQTPLVGSLAIASVVGRLDLTITPLVGALTLAGNLPDVQEAGSANTNRTPNAGALTIDGTASTVAVTLQPTTGSLAIASDAATAIQSAIITPTVGAIAFAGTASTLDLRLAPVAGGLTLTGNAPTVEEFGTENTDITPAAGEAFFGLQASPVPAAAALAIAGAQPLIAVTTTPATGSLTLAGTPAETRSGPQITPATADLTITGIAGRWDVSVVPTAGALTLTANQVVVDAPAFLTPVSAALSLTGTAADPRQSYAYYGSSGAGGGSTGSVDRTMAITPAVGDLLVVFGVVSGNTNATPTMSDNQGGTYARIAVASKNASADRMACFVRNNLITSAVSHTITYATGTNTAAELVCITVKGMGRAGANAVRQSALQSNQAGGTTPAPSFSQAALIENMTLGAVGNGATPAGLTPPTGWTERQDVGQSSPSTGLEVATRNTGFQGTTITWGGASASAFGSIIVELDGRPPVATPVVGTLTIAGAAPFVSQNIFASPVVGAFSLAGTQPSFTGGATCTPTTGALTVAGTTAGIGGDRNVTPNAGALLFVGASQSVSNFDITPAAGLLFFGLDQNAILTPAAAGLTLTGSQPVVTGEATFLTPRTGSMLLDQDPEPRAGAMGFTGAAPSLALGINTPFGQMLFTTYGPTVSRSEFVIPSAGSVAAAGVLPVVNTGILTQTGGLTLTGQLVQRPDITTIAPASGTLGITGASSVFDRGLITQIGTLSVVSDPALASQSQVITPAAGALTVASDPTTITRGISVSTGTGAIDGLAPTLILSNVRQPAAGAMALLSNAPTLAEVGRVTPPPGSLILTGIAPTVSGGTIITPADNSITPLVGSLALAGQQAQPDARIRLTPDTASLALTASTPALTGQITPLVGSLTSTGEQATTSTAARVTPSPAELIVDSDDAQIISDYVVIIPPTADMVMAPTAPVIRAPVVPPTAEIAITGTTPTLQELNRIIVGSNWQDYLYLQGQQARIGISVRPAGATLAATGNSPIAGAQKRVEADVIITRQIAATVHIIRAVDRDVKVIDDNDEDTKL